MRPEQSVTAELTRDSLESSEISSDAFSSNFRPITNNFNQITQHIQNNNNKITIVIKHNEGQKFQPQFSPQVIYIQPAEASQPDLQKKRVFHSTNDLQTSEIYNSLDDLDTEENYQFYDERAVDVPDDFKRDSYLVLNFNNAGNRRLKRRICTPTRNLMPLDDVNSSRTLQDRNRRNRMIEQQVQKGHEFKGTICFLDTFLVSFCFLTS